LAISRRATRAGSGLGEMADMKSAAAGNLFC
jgi:hypothetical protein